MKLFLAKVSRVGVLPTDSENLVLKKVALTLLPFYVFLPALIWSIIYLSLDNFIASLVPVSYILISIFSTFILYKTKNFVFFETTQLLLILLLPFILMWLLGGFYAGSFVLIWSFYAPVAAVMYSENVKHGVKWFFLFLLLVFISMLFDDFFMVNIQSQLPPLALKLFVFLNVGAGFGGIFFLMSQFIHNIKDISKELKSERETLSILANDLRSANKELEQLATCDIVTELPNRLYFQDIVFDMFKRAHMNEKIVAIMFLDLDGFKSINDTLGHEAGDMILKTVGGRLKSVVRVSDTVARVGGDEFAIALGDISDVGHVRDIAKTLIKEVNEFCPYKDHKCHVGVSIGISFYPEHGDNIEDLMQKADKAMYNTKRTGKNNYLIYKED
ncbi:MAG: GGDEF domain-containing protein [Campylobacterales bacterium]|nr:GGDEF domain-containing protein [Campylobacterales bacterium]